MVCENCVTDDMECELCKKENRLVLKVKVSKLGQKRVTIPKSSDIEGEEYVDVRRLR